MRSVSKRGMLVGILKYCTTEYFSLFRELHVTNGILNIFQLHILVARVVMRTVAALESDWTGEYSLLSSIIYK